MTVYTEEQIKDMEDSLINIIAPVHTRLSLALMKNNISKNDINMAINRIEKAVEWIRSRRPVDRRKR